VNWNYFDFYDLELVAGRAFSKQFASDTTINATVINETAALVLGLQPDNAIGKTLRAGEHFTATIVGVAKDFHFEALHNTIKPMAFRLYPNGGFWNSIKISSDNIPETMAFIEAVWKQFEPEKIFRSSFLDESLHTLYAAEERFLTVFTIFTSLAIFTGCLGIFGLASFAAAQRTREIGIRKVLGASVPSVVALLSKEFTILVGLSFLFAAPVAYFAMDNWLQGFAYRTSIGTAVFLVAGVAALLIAWLTVSFQSIKAAVANPVKTLRYE
jgi:putative ABC transport system permease protein